MAGDLVLNLPAHQVYVNSCFQFQLYRNQVFYKNRKIVEWRIA